MQVEPPLYHFIMAFREALMDASICDNLNATSTYPDEAHSPQRFVSKQRDEQRSVNSAITAVYGATRTADVISAIVRLLNTMMRLYQDVGSEIEARSSRTIGGQQVPIARGGSLT